MYTDDGLMLSFLSLGTVAMNELEKERGTENIRGTILAAIAILVGRMAKPVYILLLLLSVPCVYGKIKPLLTGKRRRRIAWTALVILGVLAALVLAEAEAFYKQCFKWGFVLWRIFPWRKNRIGWTASDHITASHCFLQNARERHLYL
ncbi:MAG: hypothetical protein V8Q57_07620, partial [Blautia sp.]